MNDEQYNRFILICDGSSGAILCTADSDSHAYNLLLGLAETGTALPLPKAVTKRDDYKHDFNDISKHFQINKDFSIDVLPEKFITQDYLKLRQLILKKKIFLSLWDFQIRRSCQNYTDFYGAPFMMAYLCDELNKCNPDKNEYTQAIIDWANIQEVPADAAYRELKFRHEGYGLVMLRAHALYTKYALKISCATSDEDVKKEYNIALENLYTNRS